jgi:lipopolysaccharide export system protein LptC
VDRNTRLVTFLKVVLPLAALGILSTLFLLSRSVDPTATLPFGEAEISDRLREERITAPYFSGTTTGGDQIIFTATSARPASGGRLAAAEELSAQITLASGGRVTLKALSGTFDPEGDLARFDGDVRIDTTTGYRLTTDVLRSAITELAIQTDGPVIGNGPLGQLEAGQLVLTSDVETDAAHLVFKNGVKLIYDPKKRER